MSESLEDLRSQITEISLELVRLLNERADIALKIGAAKRKQGHSNLYDPIREAKLLKQLLEASNGPLADDALAHLLKEVFKASLALQVEDAHKQLLVESKRATAVHIGPVSFGEVPVIIAGPCAIETEEQIEEIFAFLSNLGVQIVRAGAFKPRTSPYDFQGLGIDGLKMASRIAKQHNLLLVSEIMDSESLTQALPYLDAVQIGARNMQNFSLLKAVGAINKPIILKRGLSATIEEFTLAAEYIVASGNDQVILCERGIRTFETATRNTLDVSAVAILKEQLQLPIIVDVSHAAGRKDILLPLAKAGIAVGGDGIMIETHPQPSIALSDAQQQLNMTEFASFYRELKKFINEVKK